MTNKCLLIYVCTQAPVEHCAFICWFPILWKKDHQNPRLSASRFPFFRSRTQTSVHHKHVVEGGGLQKPVLANGEYSLGITGKANTQTHIPFHGGNGTQISNFHLVVKLFELFPSARPGPPHRDVVKRERERESGRVSCMP